MVRKVGGIIMKVSLPWVEPFSTENIPEDFEERVKESFAKFSGDTAEDFLAGDKLLYIDNLRKAYVEDDYKISEDPYGAVRDIAKELFESALYDDYGDFSIKGNIYTLEFAEECYVRGFYPLKREYDRYSFNSNLTVLQVIADIIQIVMNYERINYDSLH